MQEGNSAPDGSCNGRAAASSLGFFTLFQLKGWFQISCLSSDKFSGNCIKEQLIKRPEVSGSSRQNKISVPCWYKDNAHFTRIKRQKTKLHEHYSFYERTALLQNWSYMSESSIEKHSPIKILNCKNSWHFA